MKIKLEVELDTEKEKDEVLIAKLIELFETYNIEVFDDAEGEET